MPHRLFLARGFALIICLWTALALVLPVSVLGDRIQVALPVLGAACAASRAGLGEYAARFAGSMIVVHGLKHGLGDASINRRPNGHDRGFPSGHTAAAAFGASQIVRDCATIIPYAGPVVAVAAGFVGGSRIDAGQHDLGQVICGAVIGLFFDLSFRTAPARAAFARTVRAIGGWLVAAGRDLVLGLAARARAASLLAGGRRRRYQG